MTERFKVGALGAASAPLDLTLIDDVCALLDEHRLNGVPLLQMFKAELEKRRALPSAPSSVQHDEKVARDNQLRYSQNDLDAVTKPLHVELERLRAAPSSAPAWQPIATAPKDRTWFLAWSADLEYFVYRMGPGLIAAEEPDPTHWMPLPDPPASAPPEPDETTTKTDARVVTTGSSTDSRTASTHEEK